MHPKYMEFPCGLYRVFLRSDMATTSFHVARVRACILHLGVVDRRAFGYRLKTKPCSVYQPRTSTNKAVFPHLEQFEGV